MVCAPSAGFLPESIMTKNLSMFLPSLREEDKLKGKEPVRGRKGPAPAADMLMNMKSAFNSVLDRAGIEDFSFHDLRHTFASHKSYDHEGASLKEVQEILGHKTLTMTLRCAYLSQEHKNKAVNLLNGLTAEKKPAPKPYCRKSVTTDCASLHAAS